MPRRARPATARPRTTARRAYKADMKSAKRANRVARVVAQPERAQARRNFGNELLRGVGRTLAPVASSVLGALGKRAMTMISGQGDYDISGISHNSLLGKMSPTVPMFSSNLNGSIRVCHREYLTDILSTTDFNRLIFSINPAMPSTFPWLSKIAQNFEQYQMNGLIFEFKTGSSDALNSTNTALGYVVMATEYNSLAPGYQNKLEMENALFATSTKPSLSTIHAVECAPNQSPLNVLYTRTGFENISASDIRLYDLGQFNIATVGMQAIGANIGELHVSYDCTLYKTRYLPAGLTIPCWSVQCENMSLERHVLGDITNVKINTLNVNLSQIFNVDTSTAQAIFTLPPGSAGTYLFNYEIMGFHKNAGFTIPIQQNPYGGFVNITPKNTYTQWDEITGVLVQNGAYYNDRNTDDAKQEQNSFSDFLSFTFTVNNNNLSASFSITLPQNVLDQIVYLSPEEGPKQIGCAYITLVSPSL